MQGPTASSHLPSALHPNPTTHADESRASTCNASHSCSSLGAVLLLLQGPNHIMPAQHLHVQTKEETIHGSGLESPKNTGQSELPWSTPKQAQGGFQMGLSQVSAHFYPERYTWPQAAAWKSVLSLWKHQPGSTSVHPWAECLGRTQEQEKTCWKETF